MSSRGVAASDEALLTVLLHAAKYPSCTVCGVLLGTVDGSSSKGVAVSTALPLFHLSMLLAPCVDTALTQAEAYASQHGLALVGFYHGEARSDAAAGGGSSGSALDLVHPVGRRIAERIAERQPGGEGFLLALDNAKLAAFSRQGSNEPPLELLLREPSAPAGSKAGWRRAPAAAAGSSGGLVLSSGGSSWEALRLRFLNAHAKGLHGRLSDFDDHLDDVSRDYSNAGLLASAGDTLSR